MLQRVGLNEFKQFLVNNISRLSRSVGSTVRSSQIALATTNNFVAIQDVRNGTGGNRTHGLSLRRRSLYPTELQPQTAINFSLKSDKPLECRDRHIADS